jgi:hypothetical protein
MVRNAWSFRALFRANRPLISGNSCREKRKRCRVEAFARIA